MQVQIIGVCYRHHAAKHGGYGFIPPSYMEGSGKRPKILRDKKGNRYIKHGAKKIQAPSGLTDADFLKWLIRYLRPKRKGQRKAKVAATVAPPTPVRTDPLDITPAQAQDESYLRYVNIERERAGREKLDAPVTIGAPAQISEDDIAARKMRKEERKTKKVEEKAKTELKVEAIKARTRASAREDALRTVIREYDSVAGRDQLRTMVLRTLGILRHGHYR